MLAPRAACCSRVSYSAVQMLSYLPWLAANQASEYGFWRCTCGAVLPLFRGCASTTIVIAAKQSRTPSATRSLKNPPSLRLRRAGADWEADFFFIGWSLG